MREIYKYLYDNPKNDDGTEKINVFLGTFNVEKQIKNNAYSEEFIGIRKEDGKKYLVQGDEVSGYYHPGRGGISYRITCIESTDLVASGKENE